MDSQWMPKAKILNDGRKRTIDKLLTVAISDFNKYKKKGDRATKAKMYQSIDQLFEEMNTQKIIALNYVVWHDLYRKRFVSEMRGWEFLIVAFPLFLTGFFVEIFVNYPGNIKKPKLIIAITALCEVFEFSIQLLLGWVRQNKGPGFYRKWNRVIKSLSGVAVVGFKAVELYGISILVPNSEIKSALDHWGIFGPIIYKAMKSLLIVVFLNSAEFVFQGNEGEIFERYNGRGIGPLINLSERNRVLKLVARMRN